LEALAPYRATTDALRFFTAENRIDAAKGALSGLFSRSDRAPPTAIFCETDYIAIGAIKALQECGLRVPEDVSVVGFDDVPESLVISPELSTIRVDKAAIGKLAVSRLAQVLQWENPGPSIKQIVDTYLVKRASCAGRRAE
jgi:LacI family transcriptional regulator